MEWLHVFTIIGVLGGFMFYLMNRVEKDIDSIGRRMDAHAQRIDQLYRMFLDLLSEKK